MTPPLVRVLALLAAGSLVACAPQNRPASDDDQGHPGADDGGPGPGPGFGDAAPTDHGPVFPEDPIVLAPADTPGLFEPEGPTSGGPCIVEPELHTLLPRDWLRPRFSWQPGDNQDVFELRLHAASQAHDLVVYTIATRWTMPLAMWGAMNARMVDETITVTVRGGHRNGGTLETPAAAGAPTSFRIAPVAASGTIAYWTTTSSGSQAAFKGFKVGEEVVHDILAPADVGAPCVGCHSSTPDGEYIAFSAAEQYGSGSPAHAEIRSVDGTVTRPPYLTPAAQTLIARSSQQQPVFSRAHWSDTDRLALIMYEDPEAGGTQVIWTDLLAASTDEGTGWGLIARQGDSRSAAAAAWSHDGQWIAYSSDSNIDSGMNVPLGGSDIYLVPFGNRAGGVATPLAGASTSEWSEHYAAFSADDALVAFTRVGASENAYSNSQSEVFVVPREGGAAVRIAGNDPSACTGYTSPGVTNSWPKWSPEAGSSGGTTYYWLSFSSSRSDSGRQQIYIAPVTMGETGQIETYPAVYLWNQPDGESNHTPAWDNFDIVVD